MPIYYIKYVSEARSDVVCMAEDLHVNRLPRNHCPNRTEVPHC